MKKALSYTVTGPTHRQVYWFCILSGKQARPSNYLFLCGGNIISHNYINMHQTAHDFGIHKVLIQCTLFEVLRFERAKRTGPSSFSTPK